MDPLRSKRLLASHNLWLTAAIIIVVAIAIYSRMDAEAFREAADGAATSRAIMENTEGVLSLLQDAEGGERGYLLTGDPRYLVPYNQALPKMAARLSILAAHARARRAETLRAARPTPCSTNMAQILRVREQQGIAAALDVIHTDRGMQTMRELRALSGNIIAQETPRFEAWRAGARRHGYQTRVLVQIVAFVLAILLWLATRRINDLVGSQRNLIDDLDASREREARGRTALATTLRSIADAVITTDREGRIQFLNPIAEELTGWTSPEAEGRPLLEVFRIKEEATSDPVEDLTSRVVREGLVAGISTSTVLVARDGHEIPIDDSAAPIVHEPGKVAGMVLVFRDVTLRRRAQRELEESESRYRLLFDSNPAPMWVYEIGTLAFLAVNHAAIAHYGYSEEEFLGMTLIDIRPPEDVEALLEDTRIPATSLHTDGPWRHRKKDGTLIFVEITAHPIQFGSARACLVMVNDITERRDLEAQLRQSQKLEAVGQLAGGIAHDFNNLLTVIEGYAEMIRADQPADDPHREPLDEILVAAQRAASLTGQLLAFSRRQVLQPVRLSLNANVASTKKMLSRLLGEHIRIQTNLAADLWDVWADPGQIDQIILNLAVNGRDAMNQGGSLTIATSNSNLDATEARKVQALPGEYVCLALSDTGCGMDEETQRHIFEPFFTTKEVGRGTGLGLSTVYGIVKQSGGYISVQAALAKAPRSPSTFRVLAARRVVPPARPPRERRMPPARRFFCWKTMPPCNNW